MLGIFAALPAIAGAQTIAVSIPLSGDAAELGKNFRTGVKLAVEMLGIKHRLFIADDGCDGDLARIAADDIAAQKADIVIGALCNASAKVLATQLAEAGIPLVVAGARSVRLIKDREREQWKLWRMSPGDDYPVKTAADAIKKLWSDIPYAIVDDGTIYGRGFSDALRAEMEERGLKPQFSDTFRAAQSTQAGLLRRLKRSGVKAAFIASATTEDLVTIARNMKKLDVTLDLITTEALAVLPYLEEVDKIPAGIRVVAAPMPSEPKLDALLAERKLDKERQIYAGYAAIQVAAQAQGKSNIATLEALSNETFKTVLGNIRFHADGSSNFNPYVLLEWDGTSFAGEHRNAATQ